MKKVVVLFCFLMLFLSCKNITEQEEVTTEPAPELPNQTKKAASVTTSKQYTLQDITVKITQQKNSTGCIARLEILSDGTIKDSITFTPEALGGYAGISPGKEIAGHLIFSKFGDYNGRTLIINSKGELFNIKGGLNFIDGMEEMLFTIEDSDIDDTVAIFDLKSDKELFSGGLDEYVVSIHKFEGRYFFITENPETAGKTVWEYEMDMDRLMAIDISLTDLTDENMLEDITVDDMENCTCK